MDLIRTGAVPALIALSLGGEAAAAGCAALDGTYRYQAESAPGAEPYYLANLVDGPDRRRLFAYESSAPSGGFASSQPRSRPKVKHLAAGVGVTYRVQATKLRFLDAAGQAIVELGIDSGGTWLCQGERLERVTERMSGVGGVIRTDRVEQSLAREAGALVYREVLTTIDPPGGKARRTESRFRLVK